MSYPTNHIGCHEDGKDPNDIFRYENRYDLAVALEWRMLKDNRRGIAALDDWSDQHIIDLYQEWTDCHPDKLAINERDIINHGGDLPPSPQVFIDAVRQHPDKSALDKLKGW